MEVRIPISDSGMTVKGDESSSVVDDDFEVYSSSDGDEDGENGMKEWEPTPERIVELYNQISHGQLPELIWKCPGRREPSVEGDYDDDIEENQNMEEEDEKPTTFDFDSMFSEPSQPFGQRKNPGTLKVQQKRVASLDKILSDIKKDTTAFQLQSPRVPYQGGNRIDHSPGPVLSSVQAAPRQAENLGIPLPSAYTLTSICSTEAPATTVEKVSTATGNIKLDSDTPPQTELASVQE